jgi:UDP-glucose 4-epimerase
MARVLVTGAAGQVGCRVVRQLLERNHEVRALVLPDDPMGGRLAGLDVELMMGDLNSLEVAERAVAGMDAAVHTANLVGPSHFENNVRATLNIAKACASRADSLDRLVSVSSSGVYPNDSQIIATCYNPVDELHPCRPVDDYALSKLIGEEIVNSYSRQSGLRTSIIRPSGIVSGDAVLTRWSVGFVCDILKVGQSHPRSALYQQDGTELWHELEERAPSLDQPCDVRDVDGRPWVYQLVDARDVAHGLVCALESPAAIGEAFNISAPEAIPYPQAAAVVSEATGRPVFQCRLPVRWIFDLSNAKARAWIGYRPRWGIREMVEDAAAFQAGETDGLT